jgi:hypothetical protein
LGLLLKGIKNMENKYLAIIIVLLIIAVGIVGSYAESSYKMNEMDKYMQKSIILDDKGDNLANEANTLVNDSKYDESMNKIDDAILNYDKAYNLTKKAYENANGAYKELLVAYMKKQKVNIDMMYSWQTRIKDIQNGNLAGATETKGQENLRYVDSQKYDDDYESIKAQNPGMQEHIDKYWNN